jgi:hypothetical protein
MGPDSAIYVAVASAVLLAWEYFQVYQVSRPLIGVINLRDATLMVGAIVLGMKARDAAVLGAALMVYDFMASWLLSLRTTSWVDWRVSHSRR